MISNGSATTLFKGTVNTSGGSLFMRVTRNGDSWLQQYSTDGATWQSGANFLAELQLEGIGLYAGNAGGSSAPAFTTNVDYFRSF